MDVISLLPLGIAGIIGIAFFHWYTHPLYSIPTLGGSSLPGLSFLTTIYFVGHPKTLLDEGYKKYQNSAFKIPLFDKWVVVLCGTKLIEETRRFRDDDLSSVDGVREFTQTTFTAGHELLAESPHESSQIIRENLTRCIPNITPTVADNVQCLLQERIHIQDGDWTSLSGWTLIQDVVVRSTSSILVGPHSCHHEQWISLAIKYLKDFTDTIITMSLVPRFLKPLMGPRLSKVSRNVAAGLSILLPVIEERKSLMEEYGADWYEKPNDALQWILNKAVSKGRSNEYVIERLLGLSFVATSSVTDTLTHALYHLAAMPEVHEALREEIEPLVSSEGWTAATLSKMTKLDSFLKESQRHSGIALITLMKKAMKDVRLSDGTIIPKGTCLVYASSPLHHDEKYYPDPEVFDPLRFSRMREQDGEGIKHQLTTSSATYISWGYGSHTCPGRFFATMQMKVVLANIITHYDLKLGGDGQRPKDTCVAFTRAPARDGKVLFRRRRSDWLAQDL